MSYVMKAHDSIDEHWERKLGIMGQKQSRESRRTPQKFKNDHEKDDERHRSKETGVVHPKS